MVRNYLKQRIPEAADWVVLAFNGRSWTATPYKANEYNLAAEKAEELFKVHGYPEVRVVQAFMQLRYGPLDEGGAQVISQGRYDESLLKGK